MPYNGGIHRQKKISTEKYPLIQKYVDLLTYMFQTIESILMDDVSKYLISTNQ